MGLIKSLLILKAADVPVRTSEIVGMWLRKSLDDDFAMALVANHRSGLNWPVDNLEAHSLAGGNVGAVVRAAVALKPLEIPYERRLLFAADLAGLAVPELAQAFSDIRSSHSDALTLDEFLTRAIEGEDVVSAVKAGTFLPRSQQSGWMARVDIGPVSGHDLSELITSGRLPPDATVRDPERDEWISVDVARRRLGLDRS